MERKDSFAFLKNEKKVNGLITKLAVASCILLILLGILVYSAKILLDEKNKMQQEVDSLNNSNSSIVSQIRDIENKSIMAKNYIKIWETDYIPNQKLMNGINIQEVEDKIQKLATENNMVDVLINLSPVILARGQFEKGTLKTYTTLVVIKFNAVTDISVFKFLDDLRDSIGYFITIQEFTMERTRKIDDEFLRTLANGNIATAVSGEIKIRLYGLGEK